MQKKYVLKKSTEVMVLYLVILAMLIISFFFCFANTLENDFIIDSKSLYMHLIALIIMCLPLLLFAFKLKVSITVLCLYNFAVLTALILNTVWLKNENIAIDIMCNIVWGILIAMVAFSVFCSLKIQTTKAWSYFLFSIFMVISVAYFIELFEYTIDTLASTNLQKYQDALGLVQLSNTGLTDTIFDIFSVFCGGALSSLFISLRMLKTRNVPLYLIISSKDNYNRLLKIKEKEVELIRTDSPYEIEKTSLKE